MAQNMPQTAPHAAPQNNNASQDTARTMPQATARTAVQPVARMAPRPIPGGRPAPARSVAEIEFLPAALEILERPPSPTARRFSAAIMGFFAAALAWSWFGHVDTVAVAQGRVVPSGRTKTIQPMEIGLVRAIHVEDGQVVKAGDLLIELDPTAVLAERDRVAAELLAARTEVARLTALVGDGDPLERFAPPPEAPPSLARMHRQLLASQLAEHTARLAALDRELARRAADRASVMQVQTKLNATVPLIRERAEALRVLSAQGTTSRFQYLALQQDLVEHEQELLVQQTRYVEAEAAMAAAAEQRRQTEAEFRRARYTELTQAERQVADLTQQLAKAEQRATQQNLTAPVGGTVQQLAVHTVGGVVTPAQPLLVIVPEDSRLEVEAFILNKDIGFIEAGQTAEVKVDTFSFTRYGVVPGRVASVSADAVLRDGQDSAARPAAGAPQGSGQGAVYAARIVLERTDLNIDGRVTPLSPGMTVTAEVKTGQRRILDYLLSPLARHTQEALRER